MYQKNLWLRDLIERRCLIKDKPITLASGQQSSYYFDCRRGTLNAELLTEITEAMFSRIHELEATAVGGMTLGADPLIASILYYSRYYGWKITEGCIVRKSVKAHGTQNEIENLQPSGTQIVVVEDVISTGGSVAYACDAFLSKGYILTGIIGIIDRQMGGKEMLEERYKVPVLSLFDKEDFNIPQ